MHAVDFILGFKIFSKENTAKPRIASRSEIGRWIASKSILINGEILLHKDIVDFPVFSLVLFPKGKRITLK